MKRLFVTMALLALVCTAASAANFTHYDGSQGWRYVWDFTANGGSLQGWTPTIEAAQSYGTGGNNGQGTISAQADGIHIVNVGWTRDYIQLSGLPGFDRLNTASGKSFVFQADITILSAGMGYLQDTGIEASRSGDLKGPEAAGTATGLEQVDKSWSNTWKSYGWTFTDGAARPQVDTTLQIDYGYSQAGYWATYCTAAVPNGRGATAGQWMTTYDGKDGASQVHPSDNFGILRIGGMTTGNIYGGPYSSIIVKNAKLWFVPEPGSMLALGTGLLGLVGMIRRKK